MTDSDTILEICAGVSLFIVASVVTTIFVRNICFKKQPTLKQSPSMEELTAVGVEDPSGI